jgi:hypothetical protein
MVSSSKRDDQFTGDEAQRRFEAALKSALNTPHKPLKEKKSAKRTKTKAKKQKPA